MEVKGGCRLDGFMGSNSNEGGRVSHIPFDAAIFDLDGTLIDSAPDLAAALNLVLAMRDLEPLPVAQVRLMIGAGVPKLIERGFRARGMALDMGAIEADFLSPFLEYYNAHSSDLTTLYPGVVEALDALAAAHVKIGLCTNKPTQAARQILEALEVARYFDAVLGGSRERPKKPDPAVVHACLREMRAEPGAAFYVGDSETDVQTARNAGLPIIVVAGGYTAKAVSELGGDVAIDSLHELPGAVPRLAAHMPAS